MRGVQLTSQTAKVPITSVTLALVYSCETITGTPRPNGTFAKAATARARETSLALRFSKS